MDGSSFTAVVSVFGLLQCILQFGSFQWAVNGGIALNNIRWHCFVERPGKLGMVLPPLHDSIWHLNPRLGTTIEPGTQPQLRACSGFIVTGSTRRHGDKAWYHDVALEELIFVVVQHVINGPYHA